MSLSPAALIQWMNALPPELLWLATLAACFCSVVILHRLFGAAGLFVYVVVAVIGANIQVLKVVSFSVYPDPVGLGTILFASTYLCTDILAERYGPAAARKAVLLGFAGYLFFTLMILLALGFAPLTPEQAGEGYAWALPIHGHMEALFTPAPALFAASTIAYLLSQYHDVWLYELLRRLTGGRLIWLRNNASTMISALIDNIVFNSLAFVIFAAEPLAWDAVIFTYILGTYWLRVAVAAVDTPFVYLALRWRPRASAEPETVPA
ncbi:MAG: queuosine precursor transporter [Alphaproteobacteria bacterium]